MSDELLGNARVRLRPDVSGFEAEAKSKMSGIGKSMGGILGAAAGLGLGAAIVGGLKGAVTGAATAEQSIGGVDAVFKQYADNVQKRSKSADTALGLSGNSYRELATVIGSQLKNAGVPMDDLGGKTDSLITQGADLAAMFGGTTQEAVDALSSALKGEMDPIEKYGISLNDAALKAEAMSLGLYSGTGNLDANAKAMAVMSLVNKQGADSTGAFAREQDTAAGKTERAKAQFENFKTEIGERFLPIFASAMGFVSDKAIPALQSFADVIFEKVLPAMKPVTDFLKDNWEPIVAGLAAGLAALTGAGIIAGVGALAGAIAAIGAPILITVGVVAALAAGFVLAWQKSETFRDIVTGVWDSVLAVFEKVKTAVSNIFGIFTDGWNAAGEGADSGIMGFFQRLQGGIVAAWPTIKETFVNGAHVLWDWIVESVPKVLEKLWEWYKAYAEWVGGTALPAIAETMKNLGQALIDWIGPRIPGMIDALLGFISSARTWLSDTALPWVIETLKTLGQALVDWIGPKIMPMLAELGRLIGEGVGWLLFTGLPLLVGALLKLAWELVAWVVPRIPDFLSALGRFIKDGASWLIRDGIPLLIEGINTLANAAIEGLKTAFSGSAIADIGRKILDQLGSGLTDFGTKVTTWATSIKDKIVGAIKDLFDINSPSKVMAGLGGDMIDGLLSGILGGQATIKAVVDKVFGSVASGASGAVGAVKGAASGIVNSFTGGSVGGGSAKSKVVALGRQLQGMGLRVSEQGSFGGVTPGAHKGAGHREDRAIDVNLGVGNPRGEKAALDRAAAFARSQGAKVIWQSAGHFDHAHFEFDTGGIWKSGKTGVNLSGKPERVLNPRQTEWFEEAMKNASIGGQSALIGGDLILQSSGNVRDDLAETNFQIRRLRRGGSPHARR